MIDIAQKTEKLIVNETFLSIQGESTHVGRLCFFIRLAGCNLSCEYCDTNYACGEGDGQRSSIDHLVNQANMSDVRLVEITGGEPLLQHGTPKLCRQLLANGFEVLVETNGSLPICNLPPAVKKIVDCKTPSSNMESSNLYDNYFLLSPHDEVKFVLSDRNDYEFACDIIDKYSLWKKTPNLLFSAVWGKLSLRSLAGWMAADKVKARLQLQIHKVIWPPDQRGV
ncbi:MAG: radical SAM protein [Lentisphaerae bacterium]|nr:radical SAM protein [Lentisphaerota bacterium]MCP4102920.1 radical SAM protein [Lentisphaerota bacterium]